MGPAALPTTAQQYWVRTSIKTLFTALLFVLLLRLGLQNFHVDGQSMEPTLHDNEFILVNRTAYLFRPPARGDIIVFHYPRDLHVDYIKRIIAIPGDIINVIGQKIIVNGVTLHEPYIASATDRAERLRNAVESPYPDLRQRIVGPDQYFVLGDNRDNSSDSRFWGYLPRANIIGKAIFVYWPSTGNNFGLLPDVRHTFAAIRS